MNRHSSRRYKVYQVDAFTTEKFRGNPAGVVCDADGLSEFQMQQIARELNNSETAFLLSPSADDHDVWVRFFTPTQEVPICGHATIAAHYVRALEAKATSSLTVIQKTGAGLLPVEILPAGDDFAVVMTQGRIEFGPEMQSTAELLNALNIRKEDLDPRCPIQVVSTGHSKVLVGMRSKLELDGLKPDMAALTRLSKRIGCDGYFVFTLDSDDRTITAHSRMFAPAIGIPEDPVTGNGNGPLGAYLVKHKLVETNGSEIHFRMKQGAAMGREGEMEVYVSVEAGLPVGVKIMGRAVIVFRSEIEV